MSGRPLHILVGADAPPDPNSGAAGTVYATNQALRSMGHEVEEFWQHDLPHRISHWNLHYLLELPRAYRNAVRARTRNRQPDVVQLSQPHAWMAAREHRRSRKRGIFVNRSHGLESMADEALGRWSRKLGVAPKAFIREWVSARLRTQLHRHIDRVCRFSDGLIVPAEDIRDRLVDAHGVERERVAVIHHGVPDAFIDTPRPPMTPERALRIINIGQFSLIKAPALMVDAVQLALAVDSRLQFTWVCDANDHHRASAMFHDEFRGRVRLLPWANQASLIALLDTHGIFVAHSIYEGAAKACTEAMARGLVVVSSAVGALKDHARGADTMRLVEIGDVESMAGELCAFAKHPCEAANLGRRASKFAETLRWTRCAESAAQFYCRLGGF